MATPANGEKASRLAIPPVQLAAAGTPPLPRLSAAPLAVPTKFSFDFTTAAMMASPQSSASPSSLSDGNGLRPAAAVAPAASLALPSTTAPPRLKGSLRSPPPPPLLLAPAAISTPFGQPPAAEIQLLVPTLTAPVVQIFAPSQSADGTAAPVKLGANQRIISQAPSISQAAGFSIEGAVPNIMLKTPPLICEQGPSAPSSPTSPGGGRLSLKKPSPLSVDALQRFDLLSPNYVPSMDYTRLAPPISPGYPTSDLGSSPRSSISVAPHSANWQMFRELRHKHHNSNSSDYGDADSDIYGKTDYLMTPGQLLSPAPFSPLSDYGASNTGTPYSSRSPNLSPLPTHALDANSALHFSFSFDQVRSRSSMSNRNGASGNASSGSKSPCRRRQYLNRNRHSPMHPRSLDSNDRERSRSEGEMLKRAGGYNDDDDDDEEDRDGEYEDGMNTSINHSTFSVPLRTSGSGSSSYKKRLLQKHRKSSLRATISIPDAMAAAQSDAVGPPSADVDGDKVERTGESDAKERQNELLRRQPTIEEPPPSPTFTELFHSRNLDKDRQTQVEEWIRQQASALETFHNSLVPLRQAANLLQVPTNTHVPQPSIEQLSQILAQNQQQDGSPGPMRPATLWRRSRSESDVSVPINDAAYICEHCGQGFAMHDRLAKHIASRHRDRSASMNDEKNKIHKCKLCPKSFGRSDMLTRHMRLHTGIKPYSCQLCGQVFSRSDHLSTHQRTHTGEKPYRCPHCSYAASRRDMITRHMRTHLRPDGTPLGLNELQIPIAQLSLNQPPTPEPPQTTVFEARSISPAVFRHRPPPSASPNVNNLSSRSASSLCSATASADADALDSEDIDVEASSSTEEMELDKSEWPATTSDLLTAFQGSQGSAKAYEKPQGPVRAPELSSRHRTSLDLPSQVFQDTRPSKLGTMIKASLPIAPDSRPLAHLFANALDASSIHNQLPTATGDIGALSAAILLRQQILPANLAAVQCPSLIALVPPKTALPQTSQPINPTHPQLNAAAADSVAAKVLSAALAATSAVGMANSTNINGNSSIPSNGGLLLPATGLNSASPSKIFTPGGHPSAFRPPACVNAPNVPNNNIDATVPQVDLLALMTQLLSANPQLLASLQHCQRPPAEGPTLLQPPDGPTAPQLGTGGFGALLRQNSIGGIGFGDTAPSDFTPQHSTQS